MKIGIDARFYGEAGPGRYAKNIAEHLEKVDRFNHYVIFLRRKGFEAYTPTNSNFTKVLADYKWYTFAEQLGFLFLVIKSKLDLLYVPHFNIPVLYPGKLVTAIPDLIMHTFSTEKGTTLFKPYFKFKKFIYKLVVLWAVIRSKKVIVPSNDTLNDFLKTFPSIPKEKYVLAYEGFDPNYSSLEVDPDKILKKYGVEKPYLLYISSMYAHKNVLRLLESFKVLISKYGFKGQLVLIGKVDKFSGEIFKEIETVGLGGRVVMPGMQEYVTDEETVAFRRAALAYVFPSLKEGFSLTPMEAQYFGLPCAISDIACHREIYKDSVLYFNPNDVSDMAEKMNRVIKDEGLRKMLIEKGYQNLKNYSWVENAKTTLGVFNSVFENA